MRKRICYKPIVDAGIEPENLPNKATTTSVYPDCQRKEIKQKFKKQIKNAIGIK